MISARQWWVAFITFLVASALILFALVNALGQRTSVYETDPSPYDIQLTKLDREALDAAYRDYMVKLFAGWLHDPEGQPDRALHGAIKARNMYRDAMKAIEQRPKK